MSKGIEINEIQEYVQNAIEGKNLNVRPLMVGCLPDYVSAFLRNDGVELESDEVYITTDFIRKYISHPKIQKNATMPFDEYYKAVEAFVKPLKVYRDKTDNTIIIFTGFYNSDKVVKSAIHLNFKRGKSIINVLKSVGIVNGNDIFDRVIMEEIKKG